MRNLLILDLDKESLVNLIALWFTLIETNIAPEKWWLGDNPFLLGPGQFSGAKMSVLGKVYVYVQGRCEVWDLNADDQNSKGLQRHK